MYIFSRPRNSCGAIFALLFFISSFCKAADTDAQQKQNLIAQAAKKALDEPLINSISIGVLKNNVKYSGHFGSLVKQGNTPPDNQTLYEIGSSGKVIAGTLVARAVLDGKLKLDDDVKTYLKGDYENLSKLGSDLSVQHLLTHTSGLPNALPLELAKTLSEFGQADVPQRIRRVLINYTKADFFEDIKALELNSRPGSTYAYSSVGTELLAHILEEVYQETYHALLNEFVGELGMTNTHINLSSNNNRKIAPGYYANDETIAPVMGPLPWGAAGNAKSTVEDMLRFIEYHLTPDNRVAKESQTELYHQGEEIRLAYQWYVSNHPILGRTLIHHGGVPRAQNYILLAPEQNLGFFIITNQSGTNTASVLNRTLDTLIQGFAVR